MSETRVHAIDVTVERGGRCLLDKASLEIAAGEVVGIVGPNGASKSTLLRVLSGDLAPSSGRARLLGVDVADTSLRGLARRFLFSTCKHGHDQCYSKNYNY